MNNSALGVAFRRTSFVFAMLCLCITGCGGGPAKDADPSLVPASGTVSMAGKPLAFGTIRLVMEGSPGVTASGEIKEGHFTLMTTVSAPGARPGNYKVSITARDGVDTMDANGKPVPAKSLIPERYENVDSSNLKATIEKGGKDLVFDLLP